MSTPLTRFAFIDAVHASEILHVSKDAILDWVREGVLKPYGGRADNPFLRSTDVAALATQLGVGEDEPPRRTKSATARVQARLTADARWSDVSVEEIEEWSRRADGVRRAAARTAARTAIERLQSVLEVLDAFDRD